MEKHELVEIANKLIPKLHEVNVVPTSMVEIIPNKNAFQGWSAKEVASGESVLGKIFGRGDSMVLDFGNHHVGYLTLGIMSVGSPQDAPCRIKLTFTEIPAEMGNSFENYSGWLSRSWLQEELITVDVLPSVIHIPRRYSFRYLKIDIVDTSIKYQISFTDIHCTTVTSGDISKVKTISNAPDELAVIDQVSIKTLQDCMQTVFEDGPKRDRRLWIGDLRLQALANYYTFQNVDLVKRGLYLFAGLVLKNGEVGATVYEHPYPQADDTVLYDYSLLFVATLYDYYVYSNDKTTLAQLWLTAKRQIELALEELDDYGIVKDKSTWWCFIDWHPELNKQTSAQAVLIYSLKRAMILADVLQLEDEKRYMKDSLNRVTSAAKAHLWDFEKGFFVSGEAKQISWASQIWMVLAEVLDKETNSALLDRLFAESPTIKPATPYMYHHLLEALFITGKSDKAIEQLHGYWGAMISQGADCFWEVFNPEDEFLSPYGDSLANSYCHAWSCTPTYFIRKYILHDHLLQSAVMHAEPVIEA